MEIPKYNNCEITSLLLREKNDWRIDIDDIKQSIKPNTKCVIINFPHNPTGQVITQQELKDLISLLDKYGIWLFSDEVYRLLGVPNAPWASPAAEIYPRAISLGVMSKAFGMAGLRIGWIACQDQRMLKQIEQMKYYTTICNSAPAEILSLIALKNKQSILARNNQIVATNLKLLDNFFVKYEHKFSWSRPQGGCIGFVNYKADELADDFCSRLVSEQGVLLMPARMYDIKTNHFRIGFGRKNMAVSLSKFEDGL